MTRADLPSPDRCEEIFHAALKAGDMDGATAALTVMAPQDPYRAAELRALAMLALTMGRGEETDA